MAEVISVSAELQRERYDPQRGAFTTCLIPCLQRAFAEATGYRHGQPQRDPMRHAMSMDAPLDADDPDGDTLGDTIATRQDQMAAVNEADFSRWRQETVEAALDRLPEDERETVHLRFYAGLSAAEAAQRAGVTPQELRRRQERAFRALRHSLRRYTDLRTNFYRGGFDPVAANVIRREELAGAWIKRL